jgi:hypothetical protein
VDMEARALRKKGINMGKYFSKLLAPVIIVVIIGVYYIVIGIILFNMHISGTIKMAFYVVPIIVMGISIYVLIERIKEIRNGEEDDLSKY